MPIGISDVATYYSVGLVWVITWAAFGSYFSLLSLSCTVMYLQVLCEIPRKYIFLKNGKMVISVKIQIFSRSRMTKRISLL